MEERLPRKLAAILYADVAGYSRLTGDDEDATHLRLRDYLDLIAKTIESHHGQVMHYAGDAVLAKFHAVVDALSSAIAVQNDLKDRNQDLPDERKVQFRIGVNSGDVIEDRGDIYGDGVNVAARLESLADAGGICISESVRTAIGKKLPYGYEFMGEQQVKNIEEPVRAYRVLLDSSKAQLTPPVKPTLELPDKPSIAVLPFTNMSGDPEQEYFSDGITEDIITELSRFSMLFVIARHSSFAFKGQPIDVKEVGDRLGVRYVMEGSVRTSAKRMRITAQLVDAATGNHLWAERYDRSMEDIFDVQDEVTRAIVASLPGQIEKAIVEGTGRQRTGSLTAYENLLRGHWHLHRLTKDDLLEAKRLYQAAVDLDAHFGQAISRLAAVDNYLYGMGWGTLGGSPDATLQTVQRALAIDGNDNWARLVLGWAFLRLHRFDEAEEQFDRALALNPNDAEVMAWMAQALVFLGRAEEASELIQQAMRLNPLHPNSYYMILANAAYFTGRYDDALRGFRQGSEHGVWHHANMAATYAQLGRIEDARTHAAMFVGTRRKQYEASGNPIPNGDLSLAAERVLRMKREIDRDRYIDGLRKAGLSE